ncbi:MAG TPA: cytochrome c [Caulobacteraceae bacterium]|nr:cytochrome c [Caulobacteraceae bacterium]
MAARSALVLLASVALGACVTASASSRPDRLAPEEIVRARQAAFHMSAAAMGNMRAAVEAGREPSQQAFAARGVARWAEVLPTMFPEETRGVGPSRARAEIWTNKADFEAKAAAYATEAGKLAAVAKAGDRAAFELQFKAATATCKSCHDAYQAPAG